MYKGTVVQVEAPDEGNPQLLKTVSLIQGAYYLITGMWSIISQRTFQKVTGSKESVWLVKTAGVLFRVIGGALMVGGLRPRPSMESQFLGPATAMGVAAAEIVYTTEDRIPPVYLLDAVVEASFLIGWLAGRVLDNLRRF